MSWLVPPIHHAYWVVPGKLLAGEYPGARSESQTRNRLSNILQAGVNFFLDLTEAYEYGLEPYFSIVREEAAAMGLGIGYRRMPVPDMATPPTEDMVDILDTLDATLRAGCTVYVHCYAGIGRTGTVIGCHLARHGMTGRRALQRIAQLRKDIPHGRRRSPETPIQRALVRNWPAGQ